MSKLELTDIQGIGPQTIKYFQKKNIFSLKDLIEFYPINYQTYSENTIKDKAKIIIKGTITRSISEYRPRPNLLMTTYFVHDGNNEFKILAWNQKHLRFTLKQGDFVQVKGTYDKNKNQISQDNVKKIENILQDDEKVSKEEIIPIYSKITKLTNFKINKIILNALSKMEDSKYKKALLEIHMPHSFAKIKEAQRILKYIEFKEYYSKLKLLQQNQKLIDKEYQKKVKINDLNSFLHTLPFALTRDQDEVINNLIKLTQSSQKMQSLVLGDVGSGKTIIIIILSYLLVKAGYQVAVMAPTEILARQLYLNFQTFLKDYNVELLISGIRKREKNKIKEYTELGIINVLIGTHALLQGDVEFQNLGLAIIDEQHRFGVEQRNKLIKKTMFGEFLYLSATPIPRTLAQSIFGVVDIEVINTKPNNRKPIITEIYTKKTRSKIFDILDKELKQKHQAYVVAPTIEETEIEGLENVEDIYKNFQEFYKDRYNIGLLHGMMKSDDKIKIMQKFKNKEYDILVATTVIEVGVDVPNASAMIVINAERYGLAQLHQLRGRVGRSDLQSYCLLYDKSNNQLSKERLQILKETNDGQILAGEDLKLRGSGNFFGKEQSGEAGFKLFNYYEDQDIAQEVIDKESEKNNETY